ncbi:MAG: Holliday junction branch migration DNA helicase RuvB [Bacillales bacterium]|jgi:Holliday junction DNA helicase RuvB|nr:Holliday junction branch migration DNA helicase RuvB [Bacillales bacterium]
MENERLVDATIKDEQEISLRPQTIAEYIGQSMAKENLKIYLQAATLRGEALDHVLLYGPPGLGKTTLAYVIANEMKANIKVVTGPAIEKTGDLAAILASLNAGDVLFIDEIHRLPKVVEEVLYSAMEDYTLNVVIGKDVQARSIRIDLPPFTLVGATTRVGSISSPLRDRFGIILKLEFYDIPEICQIIRRTSKVFETTIAEDAIKELGARSRGTPRIANRLFRRIRDFATIKNKGIIDNEITKYSLEALKVDPLGLDKLDYSYLETLIKRFQGGPVGIEAISSALQEESATLEDVCEPFLLQIGFINRTNRGRVATQKAFEHLKIDYLNSFFQS